MALRLNTGTGTEDLATEEIGNDHYQQIKLADGTATSTTLVAAGGGAEANALRVTIANDSTGVVSVDDNGSSITVDGTVTANLSATDNAVLDAIEADTTTIAGAVAAGQMQVDIVADGAGLATAANQLPDGHNVTVDNASGASAVNVQDGGNSLTVDNANVDNLHSADFDTGAGTDTTTAVGIAVPASGGAVVVPGDATAGLKVDLGADNDVVVSGTVTANLSATDNAVLDSIDASNAAIQTAVELIDNAIAGSEMQVDVVTSALPTGAATAANQLPDGHNVTIDNASGASAVNIQDGGNSITIDGTVTANAGTGDFLSVAAHTANEALKEAMAVGGQLDDTATTAATENNVASARITAQRAFHTNLRNNAGTEIGTATDPIRTNPTGTTPQPVSGTVTTNVGTGTRPVAGAIAHDAVDSGNPLKLGAKAVASLEAQTAVAANDRTQLYADTDGVLVVKNLTTFGDIISERVSNTDGASTAFSTFGAPGAGKRNYLSSITVTNTSATNGYVDIRDGTSGAVLWTVPLPANGGATHSFGPVPLRQPTANTALAYDVSAALTTVYISINGFQSVL